MSFNENSILRDLRNNSKNSDPDPLFIKNTKDNLLSKDNKKKFSLNSLLPKLKFLIPIFGLVFVIIGTTGVIYLNNLNIKKNDEDLPLISAELLENPVAGELILGPGLADKENVQEYLKLVGGSIIDEDEIVAGSFSMNFKEGTTEEQVNAYASSFGGKVVGSIPQLNYWTIEVADKSLTVDKIPSSDIVKAAEPETLSFLTQVNDPDFSKQWALPHVNAIDAWQSIKPDNKIISVAVVDSGACFGHPDMQGVFTSGFNALSPGTSPEDENGHGCSVSGVIAASSNNGIGISGITPKVKVYPVKVFGASGSTTSSLVAQGILNAADSGASIINLSLGSTSQSSVRDAAVNYALSKGITVVASAGNSASSGPHYPSDLPGVISVGSVDSNGQRSWFSNYGANVDIYAPGGGIYTTKVGNTYGFSSGTSFSAPYVSGAIALQFYFCQPALSGSVSGQLIMNKINGKWSQCDPNKAPTLTSTPPTNSLFVGDTYSYELTAQDPENNTLNFGFTPNRENALINSSTGEFTWTNVPAGSHEFSLTVTDGEFTVEQKITVVVENKPTPTPTKVIVYQPPAPTGPVGETPLVSSFFTNAQSEYDTWLANNPNSACAASSLLTVTSTKVNNFQLWACSSLDSNTFLALQKNFITGAIIPVKFNFNLTACADYFWKTHTTATGKLEGNQCLIDQMIARDLP